MSSKKNFYCLANSAKSYDSRLYSKAPQIKIHHKEIYSRFFALDFDSFNFAYAVQLHR